MLLRRASARSLNKNICQRFLITYNATLNTAFSLKSMPYFECVLFARKGLLICLLTLYRYSEPIVQGCLSLGVNGAFLLLLYCSRPFVYFPSSWLKMNLYQMAEVNSCFICLAGNSLGLIGALDSSYTKMIRNMLALQNVCFFSLFVCAYGLELRHAMNIAKLRSKSGAGKNLVGMNLGKDLNGALGEWYFAVNCVS